MSPRRRFRNPLGFSMIELVTASAISVLVLGALGSLLLGSFQIVKLLDSRKDAALEGALIALEHMVGELQKAPVYQSHPLEADAEHIRFVQVLTRVASDPYEKAFKLGQVQEFSMSGTATRIRTVEYLFDASRGVLLRQVDKGQERILADHLSGVQFSYALGSLEEGGSDWVWTDRLESPQDEQRLRAVRARLEFNKTGLRYILPAVEKTFVARRGGDDAPV